MAIKSRQAAAAKAAEATNSKPSKKGDPAVRKIVFDATGYPDKEAVTKYLEANGYDGYTITKKDATFVAEGVLIDADVTDVRSVKMTEPDDGSNPVIGYVGKLSDDGVKKLSGEKTAKSTEKVESVLKMDYWAMYSSKGATVGEVLESGMTDGLPPGVSEVLTATALAVGNVIASEDTAKVRATKLAAIGGEMSGIISELANLYETAVEMEAVKKTANITKFCEQFETEVTNMAEHGISIKTADTPVADPAVQVPAPKTPAAAGVAGTLDMAALAGMVGTTIKEALAPVQKSIRDLDAKVNTVAATATKAATAAESVASRQQVRKGLGEENVGGPEAADVAATAKAATFKSNLRNTLGLSRGN